MLVAALIQAFANFRLGEKGDIVKLLTVLWPGESLDGGWCASDERLGLKDLEPDWTRSIHSGGVLAARCLGHVEQQWTLVNDSSIDGETNGITSIDGQGLDGRAGVVFEATHQGGVEVEQGEMVDVIPGSTNVLVVRIGDTIVDDVLKSIYGGMLDQNPSK